MLLCGKVLFEVFVLHLFAESQFAAWQPDVTRHKTDINSQEGKRPPLMINDHKAGFWSTKPHPLVVMMFVSDLLFAIIYLPGIIHFSQSKSFTSLIYP